MEIGKDTFVILEYTLRLEDGTFLKGDPRGDLASLNFIVGYDQVLPALELRLLGVEEGTQLDLVIPAREAFGIRQEHLVQHRTYQEFPQGRDLPVGKWVVASNESTRAQYSYYVQEKNEDSAVLDYNHPLAGKDLHYSLKVVKVRPASTEELAYLRPCESQQDRPGVAPSGASSPLGSA
jgi:FKBP-type peptidyl-prolyl cis-trans isomerase SlyD